MMAFDKRRNMSQYKVEYDIPKHGLDMIPNPPSIYGPPYFFKKNILYVPQNTITRYKFVDARNRPINRGFNTRSNRSKGRDKGTR